MKYKSVHLVAWPSHQRGSQHDATASASCVAPYVVACGSWERICIPHRCISLRSSCKTLMIVVPEMNFEWLELELKIDGKIWKADPLRILLRTMRLKQLWNELGNINLHTIQCCQANKKTEWNTFLKNRQNSVNQLGMICLPTTIFYSVPIGYPSLGYPKNRWGYGSAAGPPSFYIDASKTSCKFSYNEMGFKAKESPEFFADDVEGSVFIQYMLKSDFTIIKTHSKSVIGGFSTNCLTWDPRLPQDVLSLCSLAVSTKTRGNDFLGHKGIGFKSVFACALAALGSTDSASDKIVSSTTSSTYHHVIS